ncbi:uncharacterized protein LOC110834623 isoform X2 [Zootermopsis nevadensis]|uniref:uncharacterized protein LOC110834623 isoform X2 n=1 Tax=Zootermopsis nevadensis TaxID=136037 RepID=UPI000B8E90B8|nr:uncharacterized protein LOC110834623 isoform X2 [Zootermopsis nevadensis]
MVEAVYHSNWHHPHGVVIPYEYSGLYYRVLPEERSDDMYLGAYWLPSSHALFVRAIRQETPQMLIDHDYQRVVSQASNPRELYISVMKDPESVQKEIPEIQQSMKDFVVAVENKIGKAKDVVDDPRQFFTVIAPKLFMAVKALELDGFLRESFTQIGVPDYMFKSLYAMVLEYPERLFSEDGRVEVEQTLHLSPGTVQRLKKYLLEETTIYDTFRRYMDRNIGPEENKGQERAQEVWKIMKDAELIKKVLMEHNVTIDEASREFKKVLQNPTLLHTDGSMSLGSDAAARAVEEIVKQMQVQESGVDETMEQMMM